MSMSYKAVPITCVQKTKHNLPDMIFDDIEQLLFHLVNKNIFLWAATFKADHKKIN